MAFLLHALALSGLQSVITGKQLIHRQCPSILHRSLLLKEILFFIWVLWKNWKLANTLQTWKPFSWKTCDILLWDLLWCDRPGTIWRTLKGRRQSSIVRWDEGSLQSVRQGKVATFAISRHLSAYRLDKGRLSLCWDSWIVASYTSQFLDRKDLLLR